MNRKTNIINAVLSTALAIAALLAMISVCNAAYSAASMGEVLSLVVVGAIVSGFVITLLHEFFHVVSAKKNRWLPSYLCMAEIFPFPKPLYRSL